MLAVRIGSIHVRSDVAQKAMKGSSHPIRQQRDLSAQLITQICYNGRRVMAFSGDVMDEDHISARAFRPSDLFFPNNQARVTVAIGRLGRPCMRAGFERRSIARGAVNDARRTPPSTWLSALQTSSCPAFSGPRLHMRCFKFVQAGGSAPGSAEDVHERFERSHCVSSDARAGRWAAVGVGGEGRDSGRRVKGNCHWRKLQMPHFADLGGFVG